MVQVIRLFFREQANGSEESVEGIVSYMHETVWKQGIQNVFSVNVEAPVNC